MLEAELSLCSKIGLFGLTVLWFWKWIAILSLGFQLISNLTFASQATAKPRGAEYLEESKILVPFCSTITIGSQLTSSLLK